MSTWGRKRQIAVVLVMIGAVSLTGCTSSSTPSADSRNEAEPTAVGSTLPSMQGAAEAALTEIGVPDPRATGECMLRLDPSFGFAADPSDPASEVSFSRGLFLCAPEFIVEQSSAEITSSKLSDAQKRCLVTQTFTELLAVDDSSFAQFVEGGASGLPSEAKQRTIAKIVEVCEIPADVAEEVLNES